MNGLMIALSMGCLRVSAPPEDATNVVAIEAFLDLRLRARMGAQRAPRGPHGPPHPHHLPLRA